MAANLFGDRFVGIRQPAWHGLGKVFESPIPISQAVVEAGMDYEVIKLPLIAKLDDKEIDSGKMGIFRTPTADDPAYQYFGSASEDYAILQNREVAEIIEPLTKLWPVETIGALGKGETIFISLDAGETSVRGEPIKQYFLLTDTRDGGTSMKIAFTPVRVVCQNTLVSGLRQSIVSSALTHVSNISKVLTVRVNLLGKMKKAMDATMATFEQLASAAITDDDAKSIFAAAYPMPPRTAKMELLDDYDSATGPELLGELYDEATRAQASWVYFAERAETLQTGVFHNYRRICDEHTSIANTPWAAYNSVVEFADYREGGKSLEVSTLFGARAAEKQRAFKASLEYAK